MAQENPISFDDEVMEEENDDSDSFLNVDVKVLTEKSRKQAMMDYGRIYHETKDLHQSKLDFEATLDKLKQNIENENNVFSKYGINETLALDAKNLALTSEVTLELAKKLQIVDKFNSRKFVTKLKKRILTNAVNSNFCEIDPSRRLKLIHLYPTSKFYNHLYYSVPSFGKNFKTDFDPSKRVRRAPRNVAKLPKGQAICPSQYDTKKMNSVDESDRRLEHIFKTVKKLERSNNGSVPFLQASFNPDNFSLTVENIFYMAFLARQARVRIDEGDDEDNEPIIRTKEPDDESSNNESTSNDSCDNIQSVFSFDMESYKLLIDKLGITGAAIK